MNYTITPENNKYKIVATLYEGKEAEFILMLVKYNKISEYMYFVDKELVAKFSYMRIQKNAKNNITGTLFIKEIESKIIEQAIKEVKSHIDAKVLHYQDIFSAIDMFIESRKPLKELEIKMTDTRQVVKLHQDILELLKEKAKSDLEVTPQHELSILQKIWKLKGGGNNGRNNNS